MPHVRRVVRIQLSRHAVAPSAQLSLQVSAGEPHYLAKENHVVFVGGTFFSLRLEEGVTYTRFEKVPPHGGRASVLLILTIALS